MHSFPYEIHLCSFKANRFFISCPIRKIFVIVVIVAVFVTITFLQQHFINCTSSSDGGALKFIGKAEVTLQSNKFTNNSAVVDGGAVSYDCFGFEDDECSFAASGNVYSNNTAGTQGGAMMVLNVSYQLAGNQFENNTAGSGYGNELATDVAYIYVIKGAQNLDDLKNRAKNQSAAIFNYSATSGDPLSIGVVVLDKNSQIVLTMTGNEVRFFFDSSRFSNTTSPSRLLQASQRGSQCGSSSTSLEQYVL